jgi:hypothetical protein
MMRAETVSKEEWKGRTLSKNIEADFICATVLGKGFDTLSG